MPTPNLSLEEICEIVAPLAKRYEVQHAAHQEEARRYQGVSWGGMGPDRFAQKTAAQLVAEQLAEDARYAAFNRSPRGRFLAALKAIDETGGYASAVYAARTAYHRGISIASETIDITEVAHAIHALAGVPSGDARGCIAALAEIILGERREAA